MAPSDLGVLVVLVVFGLCVVLWTGRPRKLGLLVAFPAAKGLPTGLLSPGLLDAHGRFGTTFPLVGTGRLVVTGALVTGLVVLVVSLVVGAMVEVLLLFRAFLLDRLSDTEPSWRSADEFFLPDFFELLGESVFNFAMKALISKAETVPMAHNKVGKILMIFSSVSTGYTG